MRAWVPKLKQGREPLYERIADAIAEDIEAGTLEAGFRLPPHRVLAHQLTVGIGTITKAYAEAGRRGHLLGHVGKGSFVSGPNSSAASGESTEMVDLARNLPPIVSGDRHLANTLSRLRRTNLSSALHYASPEGSGQVLEAGAGWLSAHHSLDCATDDLVQCNGGQHALLIVLGSLCRPGDAILCEASTFFGFKALAEFSNYRLVGVEMDEEGIAPDAFERAILASGARVFYTIPTLHNPTTLTTTSRRRQELIALARRHKVMIVEDDAYRAVARSERLPPSYAQLAPELTVHIATLSKAMLPGLRLGFIKLPNLELRAAVTHAIRATSYTLAAIGGLIFSDWVKEGIADRIADEVAREASIRTELATTILGSAIAPIGAPQSLHVWLPLSPLEAEQTARRALRAGVEVTPPDAPIIDDRTAASGIRVCLGGPQDHTILKRGLLVVASALRARAGDRDRSIV